MSSLGRRHFIARTSVATGAALLPIAGVFSRNAHARGYGDLVPDPDGLLDLPRGFQYTIVRSPDSRMADGYDVPGLPDGMACFPGSDGNWVLMCNHEVPFLDYLHSAYGPGDAPKEAFDPQGLGGVTRMVIDPVLHTLISSNLVLAGTVRNCAGGRSPWGWLSCEEAADDAGHGYVFLCDPEADSVQPALRVQAYGRFNHEAVAIDPKTRMAYLTEDRGNGCLYRMVPTDPDKPFAGQLQALRVVGEDGVLTTDWEAGQTADIEWVDIEDVDPVDDTIREEAHGKGAAYFSRGEGMWFADGTVWFTCTNGGPVESGQLFRLVDGREGGTIELFYQSEDPEVMDFPDNMVVAPWGQIFICEDNLQLNRLQVIDEDGQICAFARVASSFTEIAGVCFSPDGTVMFLNLFLDGITVAITGPFPKAPEPTDDGYDPEGGSEEDSGSDSGSGGDGGTGDGVDDTGSGDGLAESSSTAVAPGSTGDTDPTVGQDGDDSGCGCSSGNVDAGTALAVAAAAIIVGTPPREK